jgi:hypothetical protein
MIHFKHHLPEGQPLDDQYLGLLSWLENLLDRADSGRKSLYSAELPN